MRIIDRYIGVATAVGVAAALLLLVTLDAFFALIGELGDVGEGSYDVGDALRYIALTVPRRAYVLFPTAALLGAVLGMGALAAGSELVVLRAAGVSRLRVSAAAGATGVVLAVPAMLLGELVVPISEHRAQHLLVMTQSEEVGVGPSTGLWIRDAGKVVSAARVLPDGGGNAEAVQLADVTIYEFDPARQLTAVSQAQLARHSGNRWRLNGVRRTRLAGERVTSETMDRHSWRSLIDPELLQAAVVDARFLSMRDLVRYIGYLSDNELDAGAYRRALWRKLSYPFTVLAMVLVGMPFVFASPRGIGLGQRMFFGIAVGVGFYILNRAAAGIGDVYGIAPWLTATAPPALLVAAAVAALRRSA